MSADQLSTALIIGLLATSLGFSTAAFHFYQLEQLPQVSDRDGDIGVLGMDFFQNSSATFDIDSLFAQALELNSTHPQKLVL